MNIGLDNLMFSLNERNSIAMKVGDGDLAGSSAIPSDGEVVIGLYRLLKGCERRAVITSNPLRV